VYVKEIWRYPVKSMSGEPLQTARLTKSGIDGDRIVQVRDRWGNTATARTYPDLLGFKATLGAGGAPLVGGKPWDAPSVLADVRTVVDPEARLLRDESLDRFDVLPLLIATDGAIADFGRDGRRLRSNIVIGGVPGEQEREWQGGQLLIRSVVIGIHDLRARCNMTTFDPDTLAHDPGVLRDIVKRFAGKLALNCEVVEGGDIRVDDEVEFVSSG
jgi:MOSC domain-containing protein